MQWRPWPLPNASDKNHHKLHLSESQYAGGMTVWAFYLPVFSFWVIPQSSLLMSERQSMVNAMLLLLNHSTESISTSMAGLRPLFLLHADCRSGRIKARPFLIFCTKCVCFNTPSNSSALQNFLLFTVERRKWVQVKTKKGNSNQYPES